MMNTQEQDELEERFENWCALTGTDAGKVGAWEQFEREQA
jgi:hypothetical protein